MVIELIRNPFIYIKHNYSFSFIKFKLIANLLVFLLCKLCIIFKSLYKYEYNVMLAKKKKRKKK